MENSKMNLINELLHGELPDLSKIHYNEDGKFIGIELNEDMTIEQFLQLAMQVVFDDDEV